MQSVDDYIAGFAAEPLLTSPQRRGSDSPPFLGRSPISPVKISTTITPTNVNDLQQLCAKQGIDIKYNVERVEEGSGFWAALVLGGKVNDIQFEDLGPYSSKKEAREAVAGKGLDWVRERVAGWGKGSRMGGGVKGGVLSGGMGMVSPSKAGGNSVQGRNRSGSGGGAGRNVRREEGGEEGEWRGKGNGSGSRSGSGSGSGLGLGSGSPSPPAASPGQNLQPAFLPEDEEVDKENWVGLLNNYAQRHRFKPPQYTEYSIPSSIGLPSFSCEVRIPELTGAPTSTNPNPTKFSSSPNHHYTRKQSARMAAAREAILWIRQREPTAATKLFNPETNKLTHIKSQSGGVIEVPPSLRNAGPPQLASWLCPYLALAGIQYAFENAEVGVPGLVDVKAQLRRKKIPLGSEQLVTIGPVRNIYGKAVAKSQVAALALYWMVQRESKRLGVKIVGLPKEYYDSEEAEGGIGNGDQGGVVVGKGTMQARVTVGSVASLGGVSGGSGVGASGGVGAGGARGVGGSGNGSGLSSANTTPSPPAARRRQSNTSNHSMRGYNNYNHNLDSDEVDDEDDGDDGDSEDENVKIIRTGVQRLRFSPTITDDGYRGMYNGRRRPIDDDEDEYDSLA